MTQGFHDNLYLIDLSYLSTPSEVVYDLSSILDNEQAKNQRIKLKLGTVDFNKSQLLSIKSLIESINSVLAIVDGKSEITRSSAISAGLVYQNSADMVPTTIFSLPKEPVQENYTEKKLTEAIHYNQPEDIVNDDNQSVSNVVTEEVNNDITDFPQENFSDGYKIEPQKFETNEEDFNFESKNKDVIQVEQKPIVQESGETFSNNNPAGPNLQTANDIISDENSREEYFETTIEPVYIQNEDNNNNFSPDNDDMENQSGEQEKDKPEIAEYKEQNNIEEQVVDINQITGIQTLDDIPLDIPNERTIKKELDVIYKSTERKLDDVFAANGLKEEKYQSLTEAPKAEEYEYTQYDFELEAFPTKYLKQTIYAGQVISFDGNLVVIGDCHEGSEIAASGDITVWGELSGCAHAGMKGNEKSKIRTLKLNATQLRIANCYVKRPTAMNSIGEPVADTAPAEAMISKGEIAVYKIYK